MANGDPKRIMALKRVFDPNGGDEDYIDVPVIVAVTLTDSGDGQEYLHEFHSTAENTGRQTHVHTVNYQTIDNPDGDSSNTVDVERIDAFTVSFSTRELEIDLNNNDPAPLRPGDPQAAGHQKSHVVRYNKDNINDPDAAPWIDIELIDELLLTGYWLERDLLLEVPPRESQSTDAAQETTLELTHDPGAPLATSDDPFNPTWSDIHYWDGNPDVQFSGYLSEDTNGKDAPVRLDPFQNIVNVNWAVTTQFLFSCADGMFGSADGVTWDAAPASVPAISLAYIDGTWIACGFTDVWVSTDGTKTWTSVSLPLIPQGVAAMQPDLNDVDDNPLPAALAVFGTNDDQTEYYVYTSIDKGVTWALALTITQPTDGFETIISISGCGGAFFVSSQWATTYDDGPSVKLYTSFDGQNFGAPAMVWGPGSVGDSGHAASYAAGAVGYDSVSKTYTITGSKSFSTGIIPVVTNELRYKSSSTPVFGSGDGTTYFTSVRTEEPTGTTGDNANGGISVAGGSGHFATCFYNGRFIGGGAQDFDYYGAFIPGGNSLAATYPFDFSGQPASNMAFAGGRFGFVGVATGVCNVYTAKPGSAFALAFGGAPIIQDPPYNTVAGALGVGRVSFAPPARSR
jgi:hypothetical protein